MKAEKLPISEVQPLPWMFNSQESTRVNSDIMAEDDRYLQIKELASQGMSVQQISEKLKIPKGEVDLILSVQKGGNCFLEDGHF